jgi:aarF domain-containing kinase
MKITDDQKYGMIEAIAHLIHRDYSEIGSDFKVTSTRTRHNLPRIWTLGQKKENCHNLTRNCNPKKLDFIPPGVDTAPIVPALSRVFEAALAGIYYQIIRIISIFDSKS